MIDQAIRVASVGKTFRVWRRPSDMLKEIFTGKQRHSAFEALHEVTFDVPRGSVVGIMGRNGAGKSTLLRIIAGTLDATAGSVSVEGRVSAILELGTGFHPEYTGRENVFLGALCLGLSRAEIAARLDDIVAFAELDNFIDQPFRTYSSGMQARLTFAVATAVDPDILIIDEALAVGDARFQLRSFERVRQFRRQGKSILLVSHDIHQIVSICDHAILLEKGRILTQGDPRTVGNVYHELLFGALTSIPKQQRSGHRNVEPTGAGVDSQPKNAPHTYGSPISDGNHHKSAEVNGTAPPIAEKIGSDISEHEHRYGDGAVRIVDFFIMDGSGARVSQLTSLKRYEFVVHVEAMKDSTQLSVGILIRDPRGIEVFGANTRLLDQLYEMSAGEKACIRVTFRANLGHGVYFAGAAVADAAADAGAVFHDFRFDMLEFTVERTPYHDACLSNMDVSFVFQKTGETNGQNAV
jgi:lipopolysaccharide transport system ATP-binding protein